MDISGQAKHALFGAIRNLLRPLVRILLQHGVPYGTFADIAKWVYVDVASKEFNLSTRKQSVSRVSIITGFSRKEVARVQALPHFEAADSTERYNRAARVINGWVRDYSAGDGTVANLPVEGASPSFAELVKRYSGDVPMRAVLDELIRIGAAVRVEGGQVRLIARAYLPGTGDRETFMILGRDVADLIATIEHNLGIEPSQAYFQRKVSYDHLPAEFLPQLRMDASKRAQSLLEYFDKEMAARDRDVNPDTGGSGRKRAVVGIYYFEEDFEPHND